MDLESREDLVGVAKRSQEVVGEGAVAGLGEPLDGCGVDDSEDLAPDGGLYLVGGVEAIVDFTEEGCEDVGVDGDGGRSGVGDIGRRIVMRRTGRATAGAGGAVVEGVNQKSVSAPSGATAKKRFKRDLKVV